MSTLAANPSFALRLVHLQVTLRCNLRCPFCGQWGRQGYARSSAPADELTGAEWEQAVAQAVALAPGRLEFVVWGGEPLLYRGLPELLGAIHDRDCRVGLVSNGALLAEQAARLRDRVTTLYVSIDAAGPGHDRMRESPGLHRRIECGLAALRAAPLEKVCLATITAANYRQLAETARYAQDLGFDKVIFQNLIYLLPAERDQYRAWLQGCFGLDGASADAWTFPAIPEFAAELPAAWAALAEQIAAGEFAIPVELHPLGLHAANVAAWVAGELPTLPGAPPHCLTPAHHLSIAPDGQVSFCVDFREVRLGSLREAPLATLVQSPRARLFAREVAAGRNPACRRCPWRLNPRLAVD